MLSVTEIQTNYRTVLSQVHAACDRAGRPRESVLLLPVSKMHPIESIVGLVDLGIRDFGESRVQDLVKKKDALPADLRWHFIGNLQSNKARHIVEFVHLIHSVQSVALAEELSRRASRPIDVLLEVKISGEASKSGVPADEAPAMLKAIETTCPNIRVRGLMGMASYEVESERTRPQFRMLRELRERLQSEYPNVHELSMGMTNDFEVAIEEGATIVRVGSAIFGEREY